MRLLLFVFSICLTLASCADFADTPGKSVWSEGLWILPWATGLGAAASAYKFITAYFAYLKFKKEGNKARIGYGWLIFTGALIVATIVIIGSEIGGR